MAKRQTQITVHIYIGEQDQDIADWLNMLNRNGLSRTKWLSALLVAYEQGRTLPIGGVPLRPNVSASSNVGGIAGAPPFNTPTPMRKSASDTMMFGTDVYRRGSRVGRRRNDSGSPSDLAIKSHLYICLTNKKATDIYKKLKKDGYGVATVLKYTIRQSLEQGDCEILPDDSVAERMLSAVSLKPLTKGERLDGSFKSPASAASHAELLQAIGGVSAASASGHAGSNRNHTKNPLLDLI